MKAILEQILQPSSTKVDLKITYLVLISNFSGNNEFDYRHVKYFFKS